MNSRTQAVEIVEGLEGLIEKTRFAKEMGREYGSPLEQIEGLVDEPWIFVHFSDLNKLGLNPRSKFNTPLGIYGYPLTKRIYKQLKEDRIPFASDRKFMHVYRSSGKGHYTIGSGPYRSTISDIRADARIDELAKVIKKKGETSLARDESEDEVLDRLYEWAGDSFYQEPIGWIWNVTRMAGKLYYKGAPLLGWNKAMRDMGIEGVVDFGMSVIHESEPTQAVSMTMRTIKRVASFETRAWRRSIRLEFSPEEAQVNRMVREASSSMSEAESIILDWLLEGTWEKPPSTRDPYTEARNKLREAMKLRGNIKPSAHKTLDRMIDRQAKRLVAMSQFGHAVSDIRSHLAGVKTQSRAPEPDERSFRMTSEHYVFAARRAEEVVEAMENGKSALSKMGDKFIKAAKPALKRFSDKWREKASEYLRRSSEMKLQRLRAKTSEDRAELAELVEYILKGVEAWIDLTKRWARSGFNDTDRHEQASSAIEGVIADRVERAMDFALSNLPKEDLDKVSDVAMKWNAARAFNAPMLEAARAIGTDQASLMAKGLSSMLSGTSPDPGTPAARIRPAIEDLISALEAS